MKDIIKNFQTKGKFEKLESYGDGDINMTYLCYFKDEEGNKIKYLIQRINNKIFKNIEGLMNNIKLVSDYLLKNNKEEYSMHLIKTLDGKDYYYDEEIKKYFRAYNFINNSVSFNRGNESLNYEAAKVIGKFQKNLVDFDNRLLVETIPYFHDSSKRYEDLQFSIIKDNTYRAKYLKKEIDFVEKRKDILDDINELIRFKKIPLKTCHNDTKINNVLFNRDTLKGICMIDFDTIMAGTVLYDFGDAVRYSCNEGKECEPNLNNVNFNLHYFEGFVKGYLEECLNTLNQYEIDNLVKSCIIITLECGIRFLTDYINGDVYFKILNENDNLYKAKVHFKLVEQMEKNIEQMNAIVKKYL